MYSFLERPTFQIWLILAVLLTFKMFVNSMYQGYYRVKNRAFVKPEDAACFGKGAAPKAEEHPMVQRAAICWRNDLENIPVFLILGLGFVLAGGSLPWCLAYFGLFFLARLGHTCFCLYPRQPHRTLIFSLGALALMGLATHLLILAVRALITSAG